MKTGIIRRIDDLGRLIVPKEIRRELRIKEGDAFEISIVGNDTVVFTKYSPLFDSNSFLVERVEKVLNCQGMVFGIYDDCRIKKLSKKCSVSDSVVFPQIVPNTWIDKAYEKMSSFSDGDITVYPIFTDENYGYIAVVGVGSDFIKGVVKMVIAELGGKI